MVDLHADISRLAIFLENMQFCSNGCADQEWISKKLVHFIIVLNLAESARVARYHFAYATL